MSKSELTNFDLTFTLVAGEYHVYFFNLNIVIYLHIQSHIQILIY